MKSLKSCRTPLFLVYGVLLTNSALAFIYMDESFEDDSPFTNQAWAVRDDVQLPTAESIQSTLGVNIRAITEIPGFQLSATPNNIHPPHKQVVGERLTLPSRSRIYDEPVLCGPVRSFAGR